MLQYWNDETPFFIQLIFAEFNEDPAVRPGQVYDQAPQVMLSAAPPVMFTHRTTALKNQPCLSHNDFFDTKSRNTNSWTLCVHWNSEQRSQQDLG